MPYFLPAVNCFFVPLYKKMNMPLSRTHELFAGFVWLEYIFCFAQEKEICLFFRNSQMHRKSKKMTRMIKRGNKKIYASV
ncbi:MAG: hypothetical protein D3917_07555 [Candidatus Electrothrix sp. AX5]|nr:hypothetical protein [Candidatus Electrothrix sp. AX5]